MSRLAGGHVPAIPAGLLSPRVAAAAAGVNRVLAAAGTVLYCTVLYCTALYCTVLYCTVSTTGCPKKKGE